jgi:hypothetical protein
MRANALHVAHDRGRRVLDFVHVHALDMQSPRQKCGCIGAFLDQVAKLAYRDSGFAGNPVQFRGIDAIEFRTAASRGKPIANSLEQTRHGSLLT